MTSKRFTRRSAAAAAAAGLESPGIQIDAELGAKILSQVEFYFSDSSLQQDKSLRQKIEEDDKGLVSLALVCDLPRIRSLLASSEKTPIPSSTITAVVNALEKSDYLIINEDKTKVGRAEAFVEEEIVNRRSLMASPFPWNTKVDEIEEFFSKYGSVKSVRLRRHYKKKDFKGSLFVEFSSEEEVKNVLEMKLEFMGVELELEAKTQFLEGLANDGKASAATAAATVVGAKAHSDGAGTKNDEEGVAEEEEDEQERKLGYKKGLVLEVQIRSKGEKESESQEALKSDSEQSELHSEKDKPAHTAGGSDEVCVEDEAELRGDVRMEDAEDAKISEESAEKVACGTVEEKGEEVEIKQEEGEVEGEQEEETVEEGEGKELATDAMEVEGEKGEEGGGAKESGEGAMEVEEKKEVVFAGEEDAVDKVQEICDETGSSEVVKDAVDVKESESNDLEMNAIELTEKNVSDGEQIAAKEEEEEKDDEKAVDKENDMVDHVNKQSEENISEEHDDQKKANDGYGCQEEAVKEMIEVHGDMQKEGSETEQDKHTSLIDDGPLNEQCVGEKGSDVHQSTEESAGLDEAKDKEDVETDKSHTSCADLVVNEVTEQQLPEAKDEDVADPETDGDAVLDDEKKDDADAEQADKSLVDEGVTMESEGAKITMEGENTLEEKHDGKVEDAEGATTKEVKQEGGVTKEEMSKGDGGGRKAKHEHNLKREDLKELFEQYGAVKHVDFSIGNCLGFVRFDRSGAGKAAVEASRKMHGGEFEIKDRLVAIRLLEGDEEREYWKKTNPSQGKKIENNAKSVVRDAKPVRGRPPKRGATGARGSKRWGDERNAARDAKYAKMSRYSDS